MPGLQELIAQVDELVDLAESCQLSGGTKEAAELRERYLVWFQASCQYVPDDREAEFRDMYEGGMVVSRIRSFLEDPAKPSPLYDEVEPNPLLSPYVHPVADRFASNIRRQEEILLLARESDQASQPAKQLGHLAKHIEHLGDLISSLGRRYNNRPPFNVEDEYDLQDLLDGVLRLFDRDVEREDFAPKVSGTGSRLDWSLRTLGIAVEAKFCRRRDSQRKVRDELLADLATFRSHPKTDGFLAVVYDPNFTLENPVGFIKDLEGYGNRVLPTRVVIVPRR